MKRLLLLIFCLFFVNELFAQQFSQYNTGTLYDSFENPSQGSFTPDSSRRFASNFFLPNLGTTVTLTGDIQQTLKNRLFNLAWKNDNLEIGAAAPNYIYVNLNSYTFMAKMFTSLSGNVEIGAFSQLKGDGRGTFTDESIALFNGSRDFKKPNYSNIFNIRYDYQVYNTFGLSYREQINKQFSFGIKVAYVSGINNERIRVDSSHITFDKAQDTALLTVAGFNRKAEMSLNPIKNPGAIISIGGSFITRDGFKIQGNIKDLGFIHWSHEAKQYDFLDEKSLSGLAGANRESNVFRGVSQSFTKARTRFVPFETLTDAKVELSANKSFLLSRDDEGQASLKYLPTVILSKEMFYDGFTAVMVNPIQYKNYTASLVTAYNTYGGNRLFTWGGQFMWKSPNAEFFIGSDRLTQSLRFLLASLKSQSQIHESGSFTGADFMIGVTFKFGEVIEHPMNASTIPMGEEKGFLGRIWDKVFNPNAGKILDRDK